MSLHRFQSDGDDSDEHFESMILIRALAFATLLKATRELDELALIEICAGDIHIRASDSAVDKIQAQLLSYDPEIAFGSPEPPDKGDDDDS